MSPASLSDSMFLIQDSWVSPSLGFPHCNLSDCVLAPGGCSVCLTPDGRVQWGRGWCVYLVAVHQ